MSESNVLENPIDVAHDKAVVARDRLRDALNFLDASIAASLQPENKNDQSVQIAMRDAFSAIMAPAQDGFNAGQEANLAVVAARQGSEEQHGMKKYVL